MKKIVFVLFSLVCLSNITFAQGKIKLIIDAGHGGTDPGAKTKSGERESDLCLTMAFAMAEYAKQNNMEVIMTRTKKEQYMTHQARSGYKADKNTKTYFVSLHMDHDNKASEKGGKIYYSSKSFYASQSRVLAEKIRKSLERLNGTSIKIDDKDAVVLTKNEMPAVMVYYGFVTNSEELKKAKDPAYQKELSLLIIKSIIEMR